MNYGRFRVRQLRVAVLVLLYSLINATRRILSTLFQMNGAASSGVNAAGRNALMTSLMICCGFIGCWSPNQINTIVSYLGHTVDYTTWFYHFTVVMVFMNSCINPCIYAAKYREFQTGVRRLMRKK